jgi:hypothetical protein
MFLLRWLWSLICFIALFIGAIFFAILVPFENVWIALRRSLSRFIKS